MYLRDLSLHANRDAEMPMGYALRDFNESTYHIQEVFLSFIPRRKYVLDNAAKVNVIFGSRGDRPQYCPAPGGAASYFVEDFDFVAYFNADDGQRDEMLLNRLESSLLDIASKTKSDPAPIRWAARQTKSCGFTRKYEIRRLSRSTRSQRLRLKVFREIKRGYESWGIDITNRNGDVVQTLWIAEQTDEWNSAHDYRKSMWKNDSFVILDWLGRQSYKKNIVRIEAKKT